jgi:hypothetical protein
VPPSKIDTGPDQSDQRVRIYAAAGVGEILYIRLKCDPTAKITLIEALDDHLVRLGRTGL